MGDFGPAYAYAQQDPGLVCQECHAGPLRLPRSGTCPHCGTSLHGAAPAGSRGGGGGSGPDMETATLETMVPALLQRIVAPGLLEGLADYGDASAAADETAIESLETVKVEPHVRVEISHREPDRSPRDAAAHAAEARAAAAAGMDASSATDCGAGAGSGAAAAAPPLEMRGTASSFGTHLGDLPSGVSGSLVLASPRDASAPLENASELSGAVVLAWRGGCSFVDKVRRVQQAGAAACLVVQTGDKWPLSMSDSARAGGDITLPSAMLKPADGETSARGAVRHFRDTRLALQRRREAARGARRRARNRRRRRRLRVGERAVRGPPDHVRRELGPRFAEMRSDPQRVAPQQTTRAVAATRRRLSPRRVPRQSPTRPRRAPQVRCLHGGASRLDAGSAAAVQTHIPRGVPSRVALEAQHVPLLASRAPRARTRP